jgi:hypothetical protein
MFWSWDLLNSSFKTAKSTFFSSKITRFQYYRHLLLALADTIPKRRLRVFKIIAFILGL